MRSVSPMLLFAVGRHGLRPNSMPSSASTSRRRTARSRSRTRTKAASSILDPMASRRICARNVGRDGFGLAGLTDEGPAVGWLRWCRREPKRGDLLGSYGKPGEPHCHRPAADLFYEGLHVLGQRDEEMHAAWVVVAQMEHLGRPVILARGHKRTGAFR